MSNYPALVAREWLHERSLSLDRTDDLAAMLETYAAEQKAALRAALGRARATMDFAANLMRGLEDDPQVVKSARAALDYARHETEMLALLAAPEPAPMEAK